MAGGGVSHRAGAGGTNWIELLQWRARHQGDGTAYVYLQDGETPTASLTYGELEQQVRAIAARLQAVATPGARALLIYPPGLEFITAFFGCLFAGVVAVPTAAPRSRSGHYEPRLRAIVQDCDATLVLTSTAYASMRVFTQEPTLAALTGMTTDRVPPDEAAGWCNPGPQPGTLAFLQYTSGSTGTPKGVMVSHGNLLHNSECIRQALDLSEETVSVSWLPNFHDMGLVDGIVQPLYTGHVAVLMPPVAFLQRPSRWLQAITRYRATHCGGPNFAYDLCVAKTGPDVRETLDLSSWRTAYNGAEPVRRDTIERFRRAFAACGFRARAMRPAYGMAEATLLVSIGPVDQDAAVCSVDPAALEQGRIVAVPPDAHDAKHLVGAGVPCLDTRVAIVDPRSGRRSASGQVGEIWLMGDSVAAGYWNRPEATEATFHAYLCDTGEGPFLRTGDSGFVKDGQVFITGRIKDLIIIRGRNHYPQDIELTVEQGHPALRPGCGAAFSIDEGGEERLVVAQEIEREHLRSQSLPDVIAGIRRAIAEQHDVQMYAVVLLRTATIPKTSSGKIQRFATRAAFLDGTLSVVAQWRQRLSPATEAVAEPQSAAVPVADALEAWLISKVAQRLGMDPREVQPDQPFASYGLDSAAAVGLAADIEDRLGRRIPPTLAYDHPTIRQVVRHLTTDRPEASAPPRSSRSQAAPADAIAILGLSCRLPGAEDPESFWKLLHDGVDAVREVPPDRWDVGAYYDPDLRPGTMNTRWAALLDHVDLFDASFFGISPNEAASMDPQQRLVLEVAWEALERAGTATTRLAGSSTGVFLGATHSDYFGLLKRAPSRGGTGVGLSVLANRLSYLLDLRGPSLVVDTACSSSLLAVHLACQSLARGECDMALAGGVNVILRPEITVSFAQAGMMAPDGRCKTFDARANGYVRGEGCGVVVLKRLSDARDAGDRILAIIRGSATNQDGRSNGLTAPNGSAQQQVMWLALRAAAVDPQEIGYVETHGTGTPLGDAVEVGALREVFGRDRSTPPCALGAVKTNIGHLEAAAGVAGLIKVVLSLRHRTMPPVVHFSALNPKLNGDGFPFVIPTQAQPWASGGIRRAGVSSFSFGGSNVHVVVEEAVGTAEPRRPAQVDRPLHVMTISAKSDVALRELTRRHLQRIADDLPLADICYTANAGRAHFAHRLAVVASTVPELRRGLEAFLAGTNAPGLRYGIAAQGARRKIAFLFPGDGSDWSGIGRELFDTQPTFRNLLLRCDGLARPYIDGSLLSMLFASRRGAEHGLERPGYGQAALLALEIALADLLKSWGIEPAAAAGDGAGEDAAAYIGGALQLEDAMRMAARRACVLEEVSAAHSAVPVAVIDAPGGGLADGGDGRARLMRAAAEGYDVFVTVGPGEAAADVGGRPLPHGAAASVCCLKRGRREWHALLDAVAELYVAGVDIDWSGFDRDYDRRTVELPTYPFQRKRFWLGAADIRIPGCDDVPV